jgi:hypothetical protein
MASMPNQPYASVLDPRAFLEGYPGGVTGTFKTGTVDVWRQYADNPVLTTQVMTSTAIFLEPGDVVSNLTFGSGATAAGTPTNWWVALYSDAAVPALMAQSADQLTAAWAANSYKTLALAVPQTIVRAGIYYAAIMVKATTPPSLVGQNLLNAINAGAIVAGMKVLAQTSGSALTTTAPATIASPTAIAGIPFVLAT